jgi:hypothetical protein
MAGHARKKPAIGGAAHRAPGGHALTKKVSAKKELAPTEQVAAVKTVKEVAAVSPGKDKPGGLEFLCPQSAIGGNVALTEKYVVKSQRWNLHFSKKTLKAGLQAILSLNKSNPFLAAGSDPVVDGTSLRLTWQMPVTGKSVYGHFRKRAGPTLGPNGSCRPLNFSPGHNTTLSMSPLPSDVEATTPPPAAIGADAAATPKDSESAAASEGSYPPLPGEFTNASFDVTHGWDIRLVRAALEMRGFVVLRRFIPERIITRARGEATEYFLGVLKSFQHGFSIDKDDAGFDDVAKLPAFVWDNKVKSPKVICFGAGQLGIVVDHPSLQVTEVTPGGQAALLGVQPGWVVAKAREGQPLAAVRQPLAAWIQQGQTKNPGNNEVTFQPPRNYTPFADSQKWSFFKSRGYQPLLGLGKCTDAIHFADAMGVMSAQLWMRNFLADLHECLPTELCWRPDGVSFKAGGVFDGSR